MVAVTCVGEPVEAEWAIDLYGGASWTPSTDVHATGFDNTGAPVRASIFDIGTDTGFTVGVRGGYWFESLPSLGVGLDLFAFSIPVPTQTATATGTFTGKFLGKPISVRATERTQVPSVTLPGLGFSPELRLRWPLMVTPGEFPKGRLQPYVTVGPAWAFTLDNEAVTVGPGGKLGGGAAFQLTRYLAVFGEYSYKFFPSFEFSDGGLTYQADIKAHNLIFGISLRF